ncbi:hypothetical protein KEM52_003622, partial [Ascosphaera acerosa]
ASNSTSDARTLNARIIKECAAHAEDTLRAARARAAAEQGGSGSAREAAQDSTHAAGGALAAHTEHRLHRGRQISLQEMFGLQQQQQQQQQQQEQHVQRQQEQEQQEQGQSRQQQAYAMPPVQPLGTGSQVLDSLFARAVQGQ